MNLDRNLNLMGKLSGVGQIDYLSSIKHHKKASNQPLPALSTAWSWLATEPTSRAARVAFLHGRWAASEHMLGWWALGKLV
jgi:hypothetical protein